MKVVVIFVAMLAALCCAQLSQTEKDLFVQLHNNLRASANPTPATALQAVVWDTSIEADTQTWVNSCKLRYSQNYYQTKYGENPIYWQGTTYYDVTAATNFWFSQSTSYNFTSGACTGQSCRNYIQMMAQNAYSMACAVNQCSFGSWLVCNYKTYAQYSGVAPYTPMGHKPPTKPPTSAPATSAPTSAPATSAPTSAPATIAPTRPPPTVAPTNPPATKAPTSAPPATIKPTTAPVPPTSSPTGYASIDYRTTPVVQVLGVHDQGQCGSCWAFSTTAIIEGALLRSGLSATPLLSDQNTLDCSGGGSCNGGWPLTALQGMVKTVKGIDSQAAYPYNLNNPAQGTCAYKASGSEGAITSSGQVAGDFKTLYNTLVAYGPIGITVNADDSWYSYSSGVMSYDATTTNHAVTLIGYDATLGSGNGAWIVKNSWGASWGNQGYVYLDVNHPGGANVYGAFWGKV